MKISVQAKVAAAVAAGFIALTTGAIAQGGSGVDTHMSQENRQKLSDENATSSTREQREERHEAREQREDRHQAREQREDRHQAHRQREQRSQRKHKG
jgi:hypothetical protein